MSTCQVTIVSCVNASVTCQCVVLLILFVQFRLNICYFYSIQSIYSLILFNLVPNFVKLEQYNF